MDRVLWGDRDFEEEELMLDVDPNLDHDLKPQSGSDEDCFTGIAPEQSVHELKLIREAIRKLCGRPEPRQDEGDR